MSFGNWNIKVSFDSMPQPVATAVAGLSDSLVGAEYDVIAYLGSQEVNGTNYAVLAKQVLTTGRDTQNIVVLTFNQRPGDINANLVGITHVLDAGSALGGVKVDPQVDIPADAQAVWHDAMEGYMGYRFNLIAYLGSQMANHTNYFFAVEAIPVVREPETEILLIVVNPTERGCSMRNILNSTAQDALGYAFNW